MFYSANDTGDSEKKNLSSPKRNRTYDLLVTSPDALPLSYGRLVGAKAIKLGSVLHTVRTEMTVIVPITVQVKE